MYVNAAVDKDERGIMKLMLLVTFIMAAICFALEPDEVYLPGSGGQPSQPSTDDWTITLTPVSDVAITGGGPEMRDIDYLENYDVLLVTDLDLDSIGSINTTTGVYSSGIAAPPSMGDICGIAYHYLGGSNNLYINGWNTTPDIWYVYTGDQTWYNAFSNPVSGPRGMAQDTNTDLWQISADHSLYRCDLSGTLLNTFLLSELPSGTSMGCGVFPFGSNIGIIVGGYFMFDFYIYVFDGSNLEYIGSIPVPLACNESYGIDYDNNTGIFYWLYEDAGWIYRLSSFYLTFVETSLEQTTWGSIKTIF